MRIPALRAKMGIWIYYISTLSFNDIAKYVSPINNELHSSSLLSEMIQRSITDNYKSIAHYLETQDEHFFNALILAVYDGNPEWNEIRIEGEDGRDIYDLGLLSLNGKEKIFPVDGQHRVEGIKQAIKKKPELGKDRIAVIFVGHSKDEIGMQRTRRMFSTLNRYAKPVSMRDIIALDEDDIVAIASRELIDNAKLFSDDKILDSKTKAIPERNTKAFTSIIQYYDCNKELLKIILKNIEVKGADDKILKGKKKIDEFVKHRPDDEMISNFIDLCKEYWECLFSKCIDYFQCDNNEVGKYRNKNGGHLFFRPISLFPFTKVMVYINVETGLDFNQILEGFPDDIFWIQHPLWKKIIWDHEQKKMIVSHQKLIERLLLYIYDKTMVSEKDKETIRADWISLWDTKKEKVFETIDFIISEKLTSI